MVDVRSERHCEHAVRIKKMNGVLNTVEQFLRPKCKLWVVLVLLFSLWLLLLLFLFLFLTLFISKFVFFLYFYLHTYIQTISFDVHVYAYVYTPIHIQIHLHINLHLQKIATYCYVYGYVDVVAEPSVHRRPPFVGVLVFTFGGCGNTAKICLH